MPTVPTTPTTAVAAAASDAALRACCAREHAACFACRPARTGGLGLTFTVQPDGAVSADWTCPPGSESYPGILHGGLIATALDSAMVHALFARNIIARTGELRLRYHRSVRAPAPMTLRAWLRDSRPPLFVLEAECRQDGALCAHATAKFMQSPPSP